MGDWKKVPLLEIFLGVEFFLVFLLGFVFVLFALFLFCCWIGFGVVLVCVFSGSLQLFVFWGVFVCFCLFCLFVCVGVFLLFLCFLVVFFGIGFCSVLCVVGVV